MGAGVAAGRPIRCCWGNTSRGDQGLSSGRVGEVARFWTHFEALNLLMSWTWDVRSRRKRMTPKERKCKFTSILQMGQLRLEEDK